MKGKVAVLGLAMVLYFSVAIVVVSVPGWAQKGKPQPPPAPDPAIVYSAGTGNYSVLTVVNADGSNKRALNPQVNGVFNTRPDWSPDGKQIVFVDNALGPTAINIINVDGTGQTRIVEFNSSWGPVAWSPLPLADGKHKIAFIDHPMDPDGSVREDNDLFIVSTDGTGYKNLTNTPDVSEGYLGETGSMAWSPDASFLAIANCNDVVIYQIVSNGGSFSAVSQGGVIRVPGSALANTGCVVDVDWANTGGKLAVGANEPGTGAYDLWVVDAFSPTNVSQLMRTPNNSERECSWSPADTQITYIQGPSGGIWVINSDGTGARQIVGPVKRVSYTRPQWRRNL